MGFVDNMMARPIMTQGAWQYFEIDGVVHADAERIALGLLVYGGKARFDDATLTIIGDLPQTKDEPGAPPHRYWSPQPRSLYQALRNRTLFPPQ
jgi:hypothetical protein